MVGAHVEVDMKRIMIAGSSHRTLAEKILIPALLDWVKVWCLLDDSDSWRIVEVISGRGDIRPDFPVQTGAAKSSFGDIAVLAGVDVWRGALFGPLLDGIPNDDIATHIGKSAYEDLFVRCFLALGVEEYAVDGAAITFEHGYVRISVEVNKAILTICVELSLLDRKISLEKYASIPDLIRRDEALAETNVELLVEMPLLEVAIEDFLGLKPGDIVRGNIGLSSPFWVKVGDHKLPIKASLGLQNNHKAIKLGA